MRMRRICLPLLVALVAQVAGVGVPAALAAEGTPGLAAPPQVQPIAPPALLALEQKMGELKITSLRFSEQTSIAIPRREHKLGPLKKLLKLFGDTGFSGEATTSPQAGNFTVDLLGYPFKLRVVNGTTYWDIRAPARKHWPSSIDWIRLGPGGLAEVIKVDGKSPRKSVKVTMPTPATPALAQPPFAKLTETLATATEVRELGPRTLDGQPVTSFLAVLQSEALKSEPFASAALAPPLPRPTSQPSTDTLEVSFAQSGLPVRIVISQSNDQTTTSATLDIPAINFPLVIEAPPSDQTISVARLRALERRHRHSRPKPS
jgi:hypothetical protein